LESNYICQDCTEYITKKKGVKEETAKNKMEMNSRRKEKVV
jgi:hypothetical protein